ADVFALSACGLSRRRELQFLALFRSVSPTSAQLRIKTFRAKRNFQMTAQFPLPFPPCWLPPVLPLEERAGERRPFNILPQPAQTKKPCNYAIMQLCNDLTANA